jgi:5-methylcytosine-specific restriction endonuclease McrA
VPGCVPRDFDFAATIPFYKEARRRSRETGVPHAVDHIIALCLGGEHTASNLQVITAAANREKAKSERKGVNGK